MDVKLLVAGDFCPRDRMVPLLGKDQLIPSEVKEIIRDSDVSIVNLECPVKDNNSNPIAKEGPNLGSGKTMIEELARAGFSMVTLANNHILDYGEHSLNLTIEECLNNGINTVGAGNCLQDAEKSVYVKAKDIKIAIINCCEHEFSIASASHAGSNPLNPIRQYYAIKKAKAEADYVVMIIHGGIETYQLPTPRMKETYRFFVDTGADAVVNHHQHCYSGYEIYNGRPIFYGLGNFCFDWRNYSNDTWFEGYMVQLQFKQHNVSFDLFPYIQCKESPEVALMTGNDKDKFSQRIEYLNSVIANDSKLQTELDKFMNSTELDYKTIFEPYSSRILKSLYWRNLLPSTITKRRVLKLIDYLGCESHIERVLHYLNKEYNKILR